MSTNERLFYSSENGDEWMLINDADGGSIVRHRPNPSSGGQSRDIARQDFLTREQNTPQGMALRRLLDA